MIDVVLKDGTRLIINGDVSRITYPSWDSILNSHEGHRPVVEVTSRSLAAVLRKGVGMPEPGD